MNETNPLVSIVILSFNRKDDLKNTLTKLDEQDYENIEIIIVDNHSTDGTSEMVEQDYPAIRLIKMVTNIGVPGMNEGLKIAKGEYVFLLDDDSYPTPGTIYAGVLEMKKHNELGIIAYKIFNNRTQKVETDYFTKESKYFIGCGALIKASIFSEIGYYNEKYFLYYNELDLSALCYDAGYRIAYLEDSIVIHNQSTKSRGKGVGDPFTSEHHYYYHFISYSNFLIQRFYLRHTLKYLAKYTINRFMICLYYGYFKSFFKGLIYIINNFNSLRRSGAILKSDTQEYYLNGNISFIDKSYLPFLK